MIKIKNTLPKMTEGKKTISVTDVYVKDLRFVDETGDVTDEVLSAIPDDIETISFKIVIPVDEE